MGLIEVKFDGACNNHSENRVMGLGIAVFFDEEYIEEESKAIQVIPEIITGSSNISEWEACVEGYKLLHLLNNKYPNNELKIYSDSQLIMNQCNNFWAINEPTFNMYFKLAQDIKNLLVSNLKKYNFEYFDIIWHPREFNKDADRLSKLGIKGHTDIIRKELV